jgi:hypothetical protein
MNFEPTSSSKDIEGLLAWLRRNGAYGTTEESIRIAYSNGKGLGVFASKDFAAGDVIFTIPRKCIIGIGDALSSKIVQIMKNREGGSASNQITDELAIWMFMAEARAHQQSHFHPYLRTLDYETLPSILEWDSELLSALAGTNLYASIQSARERVNLYREIVDSINAQALSLDSSSFQSPGKKRQRSDLNVEADRIGGGTNMRDLLWARSHYMSRRYLGEFPSSYDAKYTPSKQESDLGNLGSMCPLLDILNHNSSQDWLELVINGDFLVVKANVSISSGSEIFYNYGKFPNEMLLYGYAYAEQHNVDDGVAIKLMTATSNRDRSKAVGLYYIKQGGLAGIPKVK